MNKYYENLYNIYISITCSKVVEQKQQKKFKTVSIIFIKKKSLLEYLQVGKLCSSF